MSTRNQITSSASDAKPETVKTASTTYDTRGMTTFASAADGLVLGPGTGRTNLEVATAMTPTSALTPAASRNERVKPICGIR